MPYIKNLLKMYLYCCRLASTQASKARDKMKEINRKFASRLKQQKPHEIERSRQKFLSLINEEEFNKVPNTSTKCNVSGETPKPGKDTFSNEDVQPRGKQSPEPKTSSLSVAVEKSLTKNKSKEELKTKLLETQKIINRGFQTARQLTQKVESMAKSEKKLEKTPNSEKTFVSDEVSSKSLERSRKSESNETIKGIKIDQRCNRCFRLKEKKSKSNEEKIVETNKMGKAREGKNCLVNIKRPEPKRKSPSSTTKLNLQCLPSVHIKGGLQMQRVYAFEIPPEQRQAPSVKANTAITILSHEEIEKERAKKNLEVIKKENCFCRENEEQGNRIECFNCGNLIRIQKTSVDPKEIDKLLLKCSFNVFDPRIDEFVEKCNQIPFAEDLVAEEKAREKTSEDFKDEITEKKIFQEEIKKKPPDEKFHEVKTLKIQELSQRLTRRYKEKANQLEDNYQELENILKSLFKKIDHSRELFDDCHFFSSLKREDDLERKIRNLSATKPVVLCVSESLETKKCPDTLESIKEETVEANKTFNRRHSIKRKERRKKLDKKDVKNKCKSRTLNNFRQTNLKLIENLGIKTEKELDKNFINTEVASGPIELLAESPSMKVQIPNDTVDQNKETEPKSYAPLVKDSLEKNTIFEKWLGESSSTSTQSIIDEAEHNQKNFDVETKTENDYESDFEVESTGNQNDNDYNNEGEEVGDEIEEEMCLIQSAKKLSTISEVESDLEKRISEKEEKSRSLTNSAKVEEAKSLERSKNNELKLEIEGVLNKAFEKGIAYTLKHQTNFLDAIKVPKHDNVVSSISSSKSESESNVKIVKNLEERKTSTPKSNNSKNDTSNQKSPQIKSDASASQKSSTTEVMTSLKEVLNALKDQFSRTQTLADKLTENVKNLKSVQESSVTENCKIISKVEPDLRETVEDIDLERNMILKLQNARKELKSGGFSDSGKRKSPFTFFRNSFSSPKPDVVQEIESANQHEANATNDGIANSESYKEVPDNEETSAGEINLKVLKIKTYEKKEDEKMSRNNSHSVGDFRFEGKKKSSRSSPERSNDASEGTKTSLSFLRVSSVLRSVFFVKTGNYGLGLRTLF